MVLRSAWPRKQGHHHRNLICSINLEKYSWEIWLNSANVGDWSTTWPVSDDVRPGENIVLYHWYTPDIITKLVSVYSLAHALFNETMMDWVKFITALCSLHCYWGSCMSPIISQIYAHWYAQATQVKVMLNSPAHGPEGLTNFSENPEVWLNCGNQLAYDRDQKGNQPLITKHIPDSDGDALNHWQPWGWVPVTSLAPDKFPGIESFAHYS